MPLANAAIPAYHAFEMLALAVVAVTLIEWLVFAVGLRVGLGRALAAACVANVVSTLSGFVAVFDDASPPAPRSASSSPGS